MRKNLSSNLVHLIRRVRFRSPPSSCRGTYTNSVGTAVVVNPKPVVSAEVFYKEGDQKVILRSTEGKVYHVDYKHLMASSSVFEAMMEAAHPGKEPIDIDANDHDLLHFLEILHERPFTAPLPFTSIDTILRLGEMYDCPKVLVAIPAQLGRHLERRPWTVFKYAANLKIPHLATSSLENMWREKPKLHAIKTKRITSKLIEGIPLDYAPEFIRAVGSMPPKDWVTRDKGRVRWRKISAAFQVK